LLLYGLFLWLIDTKFDLLVPGLFFSYSFDVINSLQDVVNEDTPDHYLEAIQLHQEALKRLLNGLKTKKKTTLYLTEEAKKEPSTTTFEFGAIFSSIFNLVSINKFILI